MADETWPGQPLSEDSPVAEPQDWPGQSVDQASDIPRKDASLLTFYYPETPEKTRAAGLSYSMEGGTQGGAGFSDVDLRNHTLEQYQKGNSHFVAVAMAGKPTGELFQTDINGQTVLAKQVDTGGGLRPGQIDVATSNPELARNGVIRNGVSTGKKVDLETYTPQDVTPIQLLETRRAHAVNPADEPWPGTKIEAPTEVPSLPTQRVEAPLANELVPPDIMASPEAYGQSVSTGQVTPEEASRANEIWQARMFNLPRVKAGDISASGQKLSSFDASTVNMARNFASGLTSMEGLFGLIPPVGLAELAANAPDLIDQVHAAEQTPAWSQERWEAGLNVITSLAGAGVLGEATIRAGAARPKPQATTQGGLPAPEASAPSGLPEPEPEPGQAAGAGQTTGAASGAATSVPRTWANVADELRWLSKNDPAKFKVRFAEEMAKRQNGEYKVNQSTEPISSATTPTTSMAPAPETPATGTVGERVSEFLDPTEGAGPQGLLLNPGEQIPAPLMGYPVIPHVDGSKTIVHPSQDEQSDTPPPIVYDPVEAFTDQIETPTQEDLALPTMSAKEFDNYLADLQRQDQLSQAKEGTGTLSERGFGDTSTPIASAIIDMGGLLSRDEARRQGVFERNKDWWEGGKLATPRHNAMIYNPNGVMPDLAAQSLYDAGLINDPYVATMRDTLRAESTQAHSLFKKVKPIQGFESALPSPAEVQRDLESLGIHEHERLIVHGKHYIVANPLTGEIRQLFPTRDEAMQYLQNDASPGEALVKRQPGQPDQLVAKRPDDINVQQDREIVRAQKAIGKKNLTGKDWDNYLNLTTETDAERVEREQAEAKTNEQLQAQRQKEKDIKLETKLGFKARKLRGDTGDLGQADMLEGGGDLFAQSHGTIDKLERDISNLEYRMKQDKRRSIKRPEDVARLAQLKDQRSKLKFKGKGESGAFSLQPLEPAAQAIRDALERKRIKDVLLAREGAVENFAVVYPKQRMDMVRRDFGMFDKNKALRLRAAKDLEALSLIEDHGLDKNALRRGRQKVATSKTEAGRLLLPKWDYALNNFDRISRTPNRFRQEMDRQAALEAYNGIDAGYRSNYVSHLFDDDPKGFFGWFTPTSHGASGTARWFTQQRSYPTLADAVHDGKIPKSLNAADLGELRMRAGQRLVLRKNYRQLMQKLQVNGKPVAVDKPTHGYETMKLHGVDVHVNSEVADFVAMLFEPSAIRRSAIGRGALTVAGFQKQIQLGLDTFHAARLAAYAFGAGKGATRFGYRKGLGVLELAPDDYAKAIQSGEYSPAEVKYARENRPLMMELLAQGANVAKWNDNILGDMHRLIPGTRSINKWIFDSLSRGSITQGLLENFKRILKRFPELSRQQAARKAVIEMNEQFGNLGRRTIFKHKTFQDIAQMTLLARQWVESQLRSEARAYGQMAAYPYNVAEGFVRGQGMKAFGRLGVTAQSRLSLALGLLAAGQIINYALNGKSTFDNPEGHKLDAAIPIGGKTYYLDTAQIPFEFSHQIIKYMRKGEGALGTMAHILENKLSKLARGAQIIGTGQSYRGGAVTGPITGHGATTENLKQRGRQLAAEELPVPIIAGGAIEPEPRSNWLFRRSRRPDALALQGAASLGAKLEPEETPRDKVYKMVRDKGMEQPGEDHGPGKYSQLKRALDNGDGRAVQEEMSLLLKEAPTRKDKLEMFKSVREVLGIRSANSIAQTPDKGAINPQLFTGRVKDEILFRRKLLPEERATYNEAQKDHQRSARFFLMLEPQLKRLNLQ